MFGLSPGHRPGQEHPTAWLNPSEGQCDIALQRRSVTEGHVRATQRHMAPSGEQRFRVSISTITQCALAAGHSHSTERCLSCAHLSLSCAGSTNLEMQPRGVEERVKMLQRDVGLWICQRGLILTPEDGDRAPHLRAEAREGLSSGARCAGHQAMMRELDNCAPGDHDTTGYTPAPLMPASARHLATPH